MPRSDARKRLEEAGATGVLLDLLTVPRPENDADRSRFEAWAQRVRRGEDPRIAAWNGRMS